MTATIMTHLNSRERDEFLKALEEARRAAMSDDDDPPATRRAAAAPQGSIELRQAIDRMAGRLRSYISAGLLARLYGDAAHRAPAQETPEEPSLPSKSEHEQVVDELHLTPNLTPADLKRLRRRFAKANHPDRVAPAVREQATRRMTIANSLIDQALRDTKARVQ
jgi:hypothetical protein